MSSEIPTVLVSLGVKAVSAASAESLLGLWRKDAALVSRKQELFPRMGQLLPVSWVRVRVFLKASGRAATQFQRPPG